MAAALGNDQLSISEDILESGFESFALEILDTLTRRFPVCMSSDEFHFFPQARPAKPDWSRWDRLSNADVTDAVTDITRWVESLRQIAGRPGVPPAEKAEAALLLQTLTTVGQQLTDVQPQKTQPTFYLTIASIGLAEAIEAGPEALRLRIGALPDFLDQAIENLRVIPALFRDLGLEMTAAMGDWLTGLSVSDKAVAAAAAASLGRLKDHLETVETRKRFHPPPELYARIARYHMDCRMPLEEIRAELDRELEDTQAALRQEADTIIPGAEWQMVLTRLPAPDLPPGGLRQLYRNQIEALGQHCLNQEFVSEHLLQTCPVSVATVPESLLPVRSAAAYSMPPGYPPRGGTFFITAGTEVTAAPKDYSLLTAHETYPGHHLLDGSRWNLTRPVRRHIELPLFYEGWASFSEEILFDTGFFTSAAERLLVAKRRYWRAVRGMVDLLLNSGRQTIEEATAYLQGKGMHRRQALAMVRRYALKPGYQLAYTIGRRQFRRLYAEFIARGNRPADFVQRVLAEGEIGLENLQRALLSPNVATGGQQ